jgi:hypothetical protein
MRTVGKTILWGGIAGLLLAGCLNQVAPRKTNSKSPISIIGGPDAETPPTVLVEKVVRTQVDPRGAIDLIGEAAFTKDVASSDTAPRPRGELGSFCSGPQNSSSCRCVFRATVIQPCPTTGDPESCPPEEDRKRTIQESYSPLYYEADLVRCPLPEIPDTNVVEIYLAKNTGESGASNLVSLTLTPDMSFEDPLFYSEVQRYACRWSPFIPHMMDGSVIDPIQSVSPEATLSLIYYSTNMGRAMAQFSSSSNQQFFECPPHVNPADVSMAMRLATANQFIPLADDAGNALGDDKVNFLLAKSQVGPFQVGLQVSQAPGMASEVLGYAARSVSGACPSVTIPDNMEWRKLWMYHGAQRRRGRYTVTKFQQFHMACNPGTFSGSDQVVKITSPVVNIRANQYSVYSDCGDRGSSDLQFLDAGSACKVPSANGLSRILLPIVRESGTSGSTSNVPTRCVSIDNFGIFWRDQCATSQYSCAQNGSDPVTDILGLCQSPAGTLKTAFSETSGDATWTEFTNAPVEYLFVTTATNQDAPPTLQRPRYINRAFTDSPSSEQASETYLQLGKINGADLPLCVLRKEAGAP